MAGPCVAVRINYLCCRICTKILRDPATVPCGHNFCMQCIEDYWDRDDRFKCPECGRMFPTRPPLIKNTTLAVLVRDTKKCDNGREKRKQQDTGASPQVVKKPCSSKESETLGSTVCGKHYSRRDVYCCNDKLILCAMCAITEHQGHKIVYVKEERRRKQDELKNMQTKSQQLLQQQEVKCENLIEILEQIQEKARQTRDYCESIITSVIDSLQRHYLSVWQLVGAQEQAVTAKVQITLQTLKAAMEETKKRDAELARLAHTESDVCFLQEWPSLQQLCEKDLQLFHRVLEDPLVPFEFTKRSVKELGRQLEEFCDKGFTSISQIADSGEQQETEEKDTEQRCGANTAHADFSGVTGAQVEQSVEPTTRVQFLQYACELALDPATAHDDLVVSAGDKEVKLIPQMHKVPSTRYPEKFILRRQVLCREALQAERCYYEVEVEGDKAEIALTYKGIDRKSCTKRSAFGANANSWSLDLSTNYSVSHNGEGVELTAPPSHNRIGVYLKFKEGSLSFYEVSDSMKFLYKVQANFKEPLFPGFWLGEKCGIRICDLSQDTLHSQPSSL